MNNSMIRNMTDSELLSYIESSNDRSYFVTRQLFIRLRDADDAHMIKQKLCSVFEKAAYDFFDERYMVTTGDVKALVDSVRDRVLNTDAT